MVRDNRRWWALGGLSLAVLAVSLDGTVLSVALPTLAGALHASESDLQWFQSAYLLVLAAAMLPAGLLGDRIGRRRVMAAALALFGLGSVLCAYSASVGQFIAARVLLGVAGAGVIVMALSALTVLFPKEERPRAVGVWAAANFVALPIGPVLGGWLLTNYWWGWVFLINLPVVLIGITATMTLLPESRAQQRPDLDPIGVVASAAGLVSVTYGLIEAGEHGWGSLSALAFVVLGVALIIAFFQWERIVTLRGRRQSLIDLSLFAAPSYTWGVILQAIGVLAMIGVLFTMPQYFQGVRGTDAMGSGVRLLPLVGGLVLGAVPADNIVRVAGAKVTATLGFALLATGLAMGAHTRVDTSEAFVAAWMAVIGAGMGVAMATASSAALVEVSEQRSGVAGAVMQALNKIGGPFGAAVLGSLLSSAYRSRLDLSGLSASAARQVRSSVFVGVDMARQSGSPGLLDSVRSAFTSGMDVALAASAAIALVGMLVALLFLPKGPSAQPPPGTPPVEAEHVVSG